MHAAGDRGPAVPLGSGPAARPAGRRPAGRHRRARRWPGTRKQIRSLLRLDRPGRHFAAIASLAAEGITVELDLAGAIDVAAERRRLEKDLAAARSEADQAERKLANTDFTAKAPERSWPRCVSGWKRPSPTSPASPAAWPACAEPLALGH